MRHEQTEHGVLSHWTPEDVQTALNTGEIVLIDVRTPQEYMMERIQGALLAPMHACSPDNLPANAGKTIVLHCGSGKRSEKMAVAYLRAGHDEIAHMEGGLAAWKQDGHEYVGTDIGSGAPKTMSAS